MEKKFRKKIIAIIILLILIFCGLGYLALAKRTPSKPTVTPTPEPTAEVTDEPTPMPTPVPTPTPTPTDIDSQDSITRLVNKDYPLSNDYVPADLVVVNVKSDHEQKLRQEAATALENMFNAAIEDQVYLKLVSGYRSYTEQRSLWYTYIEKYGQTYTNRIDATPGASEHQLGLAVDLGNWNGQCELQSCFVGYSSYKWLQEHAHEYGFIERYPLNKESSTGIMYSPWHWRYVGVDEATGIWKCNGWTMEEYYGR